MSELDDRWEWTTIRNMAGGEWHVKTRCNHLEVVAVETGGVVVAHLCQTCDAQLPAEWKP